MTVPDPGHPDARPTGRPSTGMDPMPSSTPPPPLGDRPRPSPDDPRRPTPGDPSPDGTLVLVAAGREDRHRHVVDVTSGELGDPSGLRARCGAAVEQVVPGLRAEQADCPGCLLSVHR
ncbi:hypothetical protein Acsp06_30380 [Actinomycetospora sp. NBRC 106375]|uniref:hypothetical protein n=1 Tax=Actinomycetospora sp. NBRC 106375 TaxID=3032207 RepID=UPI0024A27023|nr:hypothetical protein [Actinomycetospora sp. NBRC 106375]GLZ46853.1 hypothetical protein Acsp06_30380 [Actinomycetospora sp. NBRC 106375]